MQLNHPAESPESLGDQAQVHRIVRQVVASYREVEGPPRAEIPTPLKWAGGIVAALFTTGICAIAFWQVSTLNQVQLTVARMDERQQLQANSQDARFTDIERRLTNIEAANGRNAK